MHGLMNVKVTMFILLMLAILVNEAVATVLVGFVCPLLGVEHGACILILFLHRFPEFCQSCYS